MQETHDASVWQERSCHTDAIFVATRKTWEAPFPLYGELQEKSITLKKEQKINFTEIIERFIENGYTHGEDLYLRPGEYRRIGDVLDLYPIQSGHPYRVIFNFDAVEQILAVDSLDLGKTEPAGNELKIFPVRSTRSEPLHKQFPKNVLLALDDLSESAKPKGAPVLTFTAFPETQENHAHLRYLSVLKFYTLTDFLNDIRDKLQQDWTLLIVTKRAEELEKILEEERITHRVHDSKRATIHDSARSDHHHPSRRRRSSSPLSPEPRPQMRAPDRPRNFHTQEGHKAAERSNSRSISSRPSSRGTTSSTWTTASATSRG